MRLLGFLLLVVTSNAIRARRDPVAFGFEKRQNALRAQLNVQNEEFQPEESSTINGTFYPWDVKWFTTRVDHFNYRNGATWNMKVLWNSTYYKPGGPIFFYTGNEGPVEGFATATGIMWDLAPMFNAMIIFAEHRFYGASLPFGAQSYTNLGNLGYLTSEQALGDYADLLTALKTPNNTMGTTFSANTSVIAFGGSYGGMLSAWFRMKYPHIITGAWAGSAPLKYFHNSGTPLGAFDAITSRTYQNSGCNNFILSNAWNAIVNLSMTDSGRSYLNSIYNLDPRTPINGSNAAWNLNYFLREGIEYMAMVDYPYPTSFLMPMPAWPVTAACKYMNYPGTNFTDQQLALYIGQGASIYFNYTGTAAPYCIDYTICGDTGTGALGSALGWPWQECSEIVMDMCSTGPPNDVFWKECDDNEFKTFAAGCVSTFGSINWNTSIWDIDAVAKLYGFSVQATSNIILTQGHVDPWSGGGFKASDPGVSSTRGIYVTEIMGSAHHLDLRTPNTCDPNTITNARFQIVNILSAWISGNPNPVWTPLPGIVDNPNTNCQDVNNGYPWGQSPSSPGTTPNLSNTTTTTTTTTTTATPTTKFTLANQHNIVSLLITALLYSIL